MEHVPESCAMTRVMHSKTDLVSIFVYHEILMSGWYGVLGEDNQLVRWMDGWRVNSTKYYKTSTESKLSKCITITDWCWWAVDLHRWFSLLFQYYGIQKKNNGYVFFEGNEIYGITIELLCEVTYVDLFSGLKYIFGGFSLLAFRRT